MLKERKGDIIINIVLLAIGIILFLSAQGIHTGAAMAQGGDFMPKLLSSIWVIFTTFMLIMNLIVKNKEESDKDKNHQVENIRGFISTLILLFVYIVLLKKIGFVIMSVLYLFIQMILLTPKEKRNYIVMSIIAIIVPITVNYLFTNIFSLILPSGILK